MSLPRSFDLACTVCVCGLALQSVLLLFLGPKQSAFSRKLAIQTANPGQWKDYRRRQGYQIFDRKSAHVRRGFRANLHRHKQPHLLLRVYWWCLRIWQRHCRVPMVAWLVPILRNRGGHSPLQNFDSCEYYVTSRPRSLHSVYSRVSSQNSSWWWRFWIQGPNDIDARNRRDSLEGQISDVWRASEYNYADDYERLHWLVAKFVFASGQQSHLCLVHAQLVLPHTNYARKNLSAKELHGRSWSQTAGLLAHKVCSWFAVVPTRNTCCSEYACNFRAPHGVCP